MIVALDTMTLIWGLQRAGNPKQKNLAEMQYRAHVLIDSLQDADEKVVIPCIAIAELLLGVAVKDHPNFIATLQKNFFCPPFDIRASEVAARLFIEHKKLPEDEQIARKTLKADVMIVATAATSGVHVFYTNDDKCRKLANLAGLTGKDLPFRHPDIFKDAEFRKEFGLPE